MDLSFLLGQEIIADDPILAGTGTVTRKCSYTIVEAYPTMVRGLRITENGTEIYECFDLGDLVLKKKIKSTYDGPTKHGCRHYWKGGEE